MPPFGYITDKQVAAFWAEKGGQRTHESEFNNFLSTKIAILQANSPVEDEISSEEREQARDIFAKTRIYAAQYELDASQGKFSKRFIDGVGLQVKLQQAQYLARVYAAMAAEKLKATDEEISIYIAKHPEFDTAVKKAKAEQILARAKAGEDFASLADQFSEDPGNKGKRGEPLGGLYKNVTEGTMVPAFERAALALEPGQVSTELVETDFGYHIIKLEKKGGAKDPTGNTRQIYDVRHILISTGFRDPNDPSAREMPVKDHVRNLIETDKESRLIDKLVAENQVQVPDEITVPLDEDDLLPKTVKKAPVKRKRLARRHH